MQLMDVIELKTQVHQQIDELDDTFLKVIHAMLKTYNEEQKRNPIVGFDVDGKPKRASTMKIELRKEVEAAQNGRYTTIEDLKKKSEKWLTSTK